MSVPRKHERTKNTFRIFATVLACVSTVCASCGSDPGTSFARMLERAAAWSASVQFAGEMARNGDVPDAYVQDLLSTGARELDAIAKQIDDQQEIDPAARSLASERCRRLATILREADQRHVQPDAAMLRDIEMQMRDAAQHARSGAPAPASL